MGWGVSWGGDSGRVEVVGWWVWVRWGLHGGGGGGGGGGGWSRVGTGDGEYGRGVGSRALGGFCSVMERGQMGVRAFLLR